MVRMLDVVRSAAKDGPVAASCEDWVLLVGAGRVRTPHGRVRGRALAQQVLKALDSSSSPPGWSSPRPTGTSSSCRARAAVAAVKGARRA